MKKAVLIFLFALAVRIAFLAGCYGMGQGGRVSSDAGGYLIIARSLAEGKGFQWEGQPTTRRPPIFPAYMAALLKVSPYPLGVQAADVAVSALTCLVLYGLGKEMFSAKVGLLSAGLLAVDYVSIRQTIAVMSETLFLFFLLLSFYFLARAIRTGKRGLFFGAGLAGGLSLLTRDFLIFYFPLAAAGFLFLMAPKRRCAGWAIFFLAGLGLTTMPWMVRNSLLARRPALITAVAGHTFYIGNNPYATGGRTGGDWEWNVDSRMPLDDPYFLSLSGEDAEKYLFGRSVEFIRANPRRFCVLVWKKIANMWRPYQTDSPLPTKVIMGLSYVSIMIFALLGFARSAPRWREFLAVYGLIAYHVVLYALLISSIRYRFPLMPFFMIFASYGILSIWGPNRFKLKEPRPSCASCC
ncbi:MAG: glycosyltransferase family 39 protein [Candidatus Omnitrophica bacterium]|nr:glycosyltransferase family 39 protein [Candidatus Omnitrophota bacterium]